MKSLWIQINELLHRDDAKIGGAHLKRLRELAASADAGEGVSLKGLSKAERRRLFLGDAP